MIYSPMLTKSLNPLNDSAKNEQALDRVISHNTLAEVKDR